MQEQDDGRFSHTHVPDTGFDKQAPHPTAVSRFRERGVPAMALHYAYRRAMAAYQERLQNERKEMDANVE